MNPQVLTVSSKGQISLPVSTRREYSIRAGDKLALYACDGGIVLKPVEVPPVAEFEALAAEARRWAREAGCVQEEVDGAIEQVREKTRLGDCACA